MKNKKRKESIFMNRLLFACYGANFDGYDLLHDIVEETKEYGAGVELTVFSKVSRRPDHIWGLMKEIIPFKDTYITLHGPYYEVEAASEEGSEQNEYFFESYRQAFGLYRAFQAHSLVTHTNQFAFEETQKQRMLTYSLQTMKTLSKMAEKANVNLLIENVGEPAHQNVLYDQKAFIELFRALPESAGALIDIGHAIVNDWDIFAVIEALGERIRGYHIHNNDGTKDQHLPLFTPNLKYSCKEMERLLRYMEEKTPKSEWILEYAPGEHITPKSVKEDMRKIIKCLN